MESPPPEVCRRRWRRPASTPAERERAKRKRELARERAARACKHLKDKLARERAEAKRTNESKSAGGAGGGAQCCGGRGGGRSSAAARRSARLNLAELGLCEGAQEGARSQRSEAARAQNVLGFRAGDDVFKCLQYYQQADAACDAKTTSERRGGATAAAPAETTSERRGGATAPAPVGRAHRVPAVWVGGELGCDLPELRGGQHALVVELRCYRRIPWSPERTAGFAAVCRGLTESRNGRRSKKPRCGSRCLRCAARQPAPRHGRRRRRRCTTGDHAQQRQATLPASARSPRGAHG